MDVKEAAAYGLQLSKAQKELLDFQHKYALIGQHIPIPDCGCGHERRAIGICTPDHMERRRLLQPTVVQIAPPELLEEMEINDTKRWDRIKNIIDKPGEHRPAVLPRLYGWAIDLPTVGFGNSCGCALTGDLGCGCEEDNGIFFSPYGAIPISEEDAITLMQVAHRELPIGNWWPLQEFIGLENHGVDYIDDIEWGDEEITEDDIERRLEEMKRPLLEYMGVNPDTDSHLHIDRRGFSYETPEQLIEPVTAMVTAEKRALKGYKSVFKRSPRTLRVEANQLFAYPCD